MGAAWLLVIFVLPGLADVAPPEQAPGSSVGPAGATQVRMLAERVVLDIRAREANGDDRTLADDRAEAQVSATFLMRNLGRVDETMPVRFPLETSNGFGQMAQVEDFTVRVNGQPVTTTLILGPLHAGGKEIQWAAFEVTFPAGQEVTLEVAYLTRPTGYLPAARFDYLLETGAGWRDTIGSVDIIARLSYPVSDENVLLERHRTNDGSQTTPGGQFVDHEVRWHWDDLDIYLLTVPPANAATPTAEPPLTPVVAGPADERDPAIGGSNLLTSYFDLEFGSDGYLFFLSDQAGALKTYIAQPNHPAAPAKRFAETGQSEAHPSWFKEYTLLVAIGQAEESDIYALTPFSPPKAIVASPGFDGQPAGGPVWWQPAETTSRIWLASQP